MARWHVESRPGCATPESADAVRARWRRASLAAGWRYPGDWRLPEVDRVCAAVARRRDLGSALRGLGAARASTGAGLAETLTDLAALHAALTGEGQDEAGLGAPDPDAVPSRLIRLTALGWSDSALAPVRWAEAIDPLTGLATPSYLRTRLREVYQQAGAAGPGAPPDHVLALLAPRSVELAGWSRVAPMVVIGDVLRAVFQDGATLALPGAAVAAVLAARDRALGRRLLVARALVDDRLAAVPHLAGSAPVRVWLERLPSSYGRACDLLVDLGRC